MDTSGTDEIIVQRALTGDVETFGEIVRRWERRIFALAYGMLGREDDARDATQETFLAAFRNLRGFRGEARVSSWLHRIAVNHCITRQRWARVRSEAALDEEQEKQPAGLATRAHHSPARVVEGRQQTAAVRRAINSLPLELRQVVVMKEFACGSTWNSEFVGSSRPNNSPRLNGCDSSFATSWALRDPRIRHVLDGKSVRKALRLSAPPR